MERYVVWNTWNNAPVRFEPFGLVNVPVHRVDDATEFRNHIDARERAAQAANADVLKAMSLDDATRLMASFSLL